MGKRRAIIATLWSGSDLVARQGAQFLARIILARLLVPEDFGLVAILAFFVGIGSVLADGGLAVALIQRQDADRTDESSVFWANVALGALLTLGFVAFAPLLSSMMQAPELAPLAQLNALAIFFGSLGAVHVALLSKRVDFRTLALAGGIAAAVSSIVAVGLAWNGLGVWALVWQAVLMSAIQSMLLWTFHPWRPLLVCRGASLRRLGGFGIFHLGSTLLEVVYSRLYALLLGRGFGAGVVGYYSNADAVRQMPVNFLGGLLGRVALPLFSSEAGNAERLRRGLQLSLRVSMLLNAPLMLAGAALAEPLVTLLFGHQWLPAVPLVQLLCLTGVFFPLHLLNIQALLAKGEARLMFRLEVAKKVVGLVLLFAGLRFGAVGVAWSQVVLSIFAIGINTHYSASILGYGLGQQLRDCAAPVLVAGLVAGSVYWVEGLISLPAIYELVLLTLLGALVYTTLLVVTRAETAREVQAMWRELRMQASI